MISNKSELVENERVRLQKIIQQFGNPNAQQRQNNSDWENGVAKYREACKKRRDKLMNLGKHSKKDKRKSKRHKDKRKHKRHRSSSSDSESDSSSDSEASSSWSLGYSPTSNYERKKKLKQTPKTDRQEARKKSHRKDKKDKKNRKEKKKDKKEKSHKDKKGTKHEKKKPREDEQERKSRKRQRSPEDPHSESDSLSDKHKIEDNTPNKKRRFSTETNLENNNLTSPPKEDYYSPKSPTHPISPSSSDTPAEEVFEAVSPPPDADVTNDTQQLTEKERVDRESELRQRLLRTLLENRAKNSG